MNSKQVIVKTILDKRTGKQVKFTRVVGKRSEAEVLAELENELDKIRISNAELFNSILNTKTTNPEENLERIDLDDVLTQFSKDTGNSTFIIARSRVGKTHLLCKLLQKLMVWDDQLVPIIFAGNPSSEPYQTLNKRVPIFAGFRPSVLETLKTINDFMPTDKQFHFLVVLDDILDARNSGTLRNLCLSYRNVNISSIICIQSPTLVQRNVRNSATCYLMGQTTGQETTGMLEKFLQYLPYFKRIKNKDLQHAELSDLTKNHEFLAYFPLTPDDILYRIKAPP